MNDLIREHFNASGEPKVARSEKNAMEYAADFGLAAYPCTFCDWWHVGQNTGWEEE